MLEKEFEYYLSHQEELAQKYNGKFLVISGEKVVGIYQSNSEAYNEATKSYPLGTFLIQHCTFGKEGHTQIFHSRVIFNQLA